MEEPAPQPEESPDEPAEPEDEHTEDQPPQEELDLEVLPPIEPAEESIPAVEETASGWWWLILALLLTGGGVFLHFWRRRESGSPEQPESPAPVLPVAADEDLPLEIPAVDCRLSLEGMLQDGTPISLGRATSSKAINLTIGRGQADLRIESAAVSRQHASLNGTAQALTLSDLGSNNGTSVNGVPCLEGEILYVQPGDIIILGDARLTLNIIAEGDSEWT